MSRHRLDNNGSKWDFVRVAKIAVIVMALAAIGIFGLALGLAMGMRL